MKPKACFTVGAAEAQGRDMPGTERQGRGVELGVLRLPRERRQPVGLFCDVHSAPGLAAMLSADRAVGHIASISACGLRARMMCAPPSPCLRERPGCSQESVFWAQPSLSH